MRSLIIISLCLLLHGCAGAKIQSATSARAPSHTVHAIAVSPSGGVLADAISVELFNLGYQVYDTQQTSNMLIRMDMSELEVSKPANLKKLRDEGIDGYISAKSVSGEDGRPESASVRVTSTHTGELIAGVTWQNGWGGREGSPADRIMRANLSEAASQIANELDKRMQ